MSDYLTVSEFSRATRQLPSRIYELLTAQRLDAKRVDGKWLIAASEVPKFTLGASKTGRKPKNKEIG